MRDIIETLNMGRTAVQELFAMICHYLTIVDIKEGRACNGRGAEVGRPEYST